MVWFHTPEIRLLLAACHADVGSRTIETLLPRIRDWPGLLARATRLGVSALLYRGLRQLSEGSGVPEAILDQLKRVFHAHAADHLRRRQALGAILGAFAREGVPVAALKGAALAELVYPHPAYRPMSDLDLLVRRANLDAAETILRGLGYAPDDSATRSAEWYRDQHLHLVPYVPRDGSHAVELHHHIVRAPTAARVPIDELWRHARPVRLAAQPALVFAPEDLLLHVCLHLALTDRFLGRFRGPCDATAIIGCYRNELDWTRLVRTVEVAGVATYLYAALWLAQELLRAEVPAEVKEQLKLVLAEHVDEVLDTALHPRPAAEERPLPVAPVAAAPKPAI